MDHVLETFSKINWSYSPDDPSALAQLKRRIARRARLGRTLTYSELADGVEFDLPGLADRPHRIDVHNWSQLDRAIVGDFLGYISMESYQLGRFLASALVVGKDDHVPGAGFYGLLNDLDMIASKDDPRGSVIWGEHVELAKQWYRSHR